MLASTRLPIPLVSASDSFWAKPIWIENFFEPDDSLARAESTLVNDAWRADTMVDAAAWVEIDAPVETVTIEPDRLMFSADTVMRREPSADANAVICGRRAVDQVVAVEHGVADDRGDLIAQSDEVLVHRRAARGIERGVGGRPEPWSSFRRAGRRSTEPADIATSTEDMPRLRLSVTAV